MCHLFMLIGWLVFGGAVFSQQPQAGAPADDDSVQAVMDDDGGRAFIINSRNFKRLTKLRRFGGGAIVEPEQYSIFLGSRWATSQLRGREPKLSNLLSSIRSQVETEKLSSYGIANCFAVTISQEVLTSFDNDERFSDLRARAALAELVNSGSLPRSGPSTIYVIFLEPGLNSTLGTLTGRKHYLAYHQFFNIAGQRLHYVVVPYEPDLERAQAIALRAFVAAAINPLGAFGN
ncbi:MAG: hypothetical protein M3Y84_09215 [Acidobacteriota bacterium]|nr:hypothetical protein [Acidobacteriota bacterium]